MTASTRRFPPLLRRALRPSEARCYRHCRRPLRPRALRSALPGIWQVYACPGGAVSVVTYFELSNRDPTPQVRAYLRRFTVPASLVRGWDLRSARRHGPELGRPAERFLARSRPGAEIRGTYWRVYPFKDPRGIERRLFACTRHATPEIVFFSAPATSERPRCPRCPPSRRAALR